MALLALDHSTLTAGGGQGAGWTDNGGLGGATSSSLVDQAGEVVEAKEGAEVSAPTSPFDRLPDELVSRILDFVSGYLNDLCLNKRLRRLALPLWAEGLETTSEDQERLLRALIVRHELQPLVRSFSGHFPSSLATFPYECTALSLFSNLRYLYLKSNFVGEEEGTVVLPTVFTETLSSLRHLRHLGVDLETTSFALEDASFSIGRNLPALHTLDYASWTEEGGESILPQLLRDPVPNLAVLDFVDQATDYEAYSLIPWCTTKVVKVGFPLAGDVPVKVALGGLAQAIEAETELPLETFRLYSLFFTRLGPAQTHHVFSSTQMEALWALFGATRLRRFSCEIEMENLVLPEQLSPLLSVTDLFIEGRETKLFKPDEYRTFDGILRLFPSLQHLYVKDVDFRGLSNWSETQDAPPPSSRFFAVRPTVAALLVYLRESEVKTFTLVENAVQYRWTRRSSAEDFAVDTFRQ